MHWNIGRVRTIGFIVMTSNADISNAAACIRAGDLVVMPTETVYGLAADATNDAAVARIFEAKGRPRFNPLICHVADAEMAARYVVVPPLAQKLIEAFWPGPLTLVLPRRPDAELSLLVSAGLDTVAVRAPGHESARALIRAADRPLAAPSANRSGRISPTTAQHVRDGQLLIAPAAIIDGGPCRVGIESTIVKIDDGVVTMLRPGGAARSDIERVLGGPLASPPQTDKPQAPGMLASHYAPRAGLRLNAATAGSDEAFLGFGPVGGGGARANENLSEAGDINEAAANLFRCLRVLDERCQALGLTAIAVAPIPQVGLGEAVNDRLARAAAPRA